MSTRQTTRKSNYELLRIVSMLMIITLHYLDKGNLLPEINKDMGFMGYAVWILKAFSIVAVNTYVLISGYFGWEKTGFSFKKVAELWLQIFFYSVVIGGICLALGVTSLSNLNVYALSEYLFPILTEQYWFGTAFIILMLFMPFLNAGTRGLEKRQFAQIIGIFILLFSISKTILPIFLPLDKFGYDVLWFVCVYLVGSYVGRFGFGKISKKWQFALIYIFSALGIFSLELLFQFVFQKTGNLEAFIGTSFHYNQLLCLAGALGLLGLFGCVKIPEGFLSKAINVLASATFGVYLIHEHKDIRYLWPTWFHTDKVVDKPVLMIHWIVTVLIVFFVCVLLEKVRQILFQRILKKKHK